MDPFTIGLFAVMGRILAQGLKSSELVRAADEKLENHLKEKKFKREQEAKKEKMRLQFQQERERQEKLKKVQDGRITQKVHCRVCNETYNRWYKAINCARCGADESYINIHQSSNKEADSVLKRDSTIREEIKIWCRNLRKDKILQAQCPLCSTVVTVERMIQHYDKCHS